MMKSNQKTQNNLYFNLLINKKGTPYFGITGTEYLRINCIKEPVALLNLLNGAMQMLQPIINGIMTFNFYSRGPSEWTVELEKTEKKFCFHLFLATTEFVEDEKAKDGMQSIKTLHWAFDWEGKMEEFNRAVEQLLKTSPYQLNGKLKKGLLV